MPLVQYLSGKLELTVWFPVFFFLPSIITAIRQRALFLGYKSFWQRSKCGIELEGLLSLDII